ncbi:hypothetical protein TBR22_A10350 [Luteitalea sp. TBR-22]|uniref:ATP-binding protein n=1 Tax=Luteitalea sp. TBR-22 TaxID=2802971 RepID=UPI001AF2D563|nr:ATP-binding protein [Luteitalea sp. TBR-22]BCS31833.1 hypothetical protein TBR22_A10350 [Luteitalea sp. TBR-22]
MPSSLVGIMKGVGPRITDVDDVFLAIVGYTREDFERGQMDWTAMTPPEFLHLDEAGIQQAMAAGSGGFTVPYCKEFFRKDGSRVAVMLCCAFIPDAPPDTWMGYVVDLSRPVVARAEPKDAAASFGRIEPTAFYQRLIAELVRERTRLLSVFDSTTSLVWSVDPDLRLQVANQTYQARIRALRGRPLEVGESVLLPQLPDALRAKWTDWYHRALAGETFVCHTSADLTPPHSAWDHALAPIRDPSGRIVGASVVSQNVDARVRAERRAEQRERELLEAQRIARIGSWDWNLRTGKVTLSSSQQELLGLPPDSVVPPFEEHARFYTSESWQRLREAVALALAEGRPYTLDMELVGVPGVRWVVARGEPVYGEDGEVTGLHGITQDVTDRRQAEDERHRLEGLLIQAQKMEAIGQLAGGIAHDFNNLLTSVLLQLGELHATPDLSDAVRAGLLEIEAASQRAAGLTRQLLAFSRRQHLQLRDVELNALVTGFLGMLRRVIGEHVSLTFDGAPEALHLHADPGMLEQVVMNLVVNARDAMPRGGTIHVRTRPLVLGPHDVQGRPGARAGSFLALEVTDTGTGIADHDAPHLFEPFFTTKEAGKGTGLGLATAYGIVTQHGGWIEVESTMGVGATFRVVLPRADAEGRPAEPAKAPAAVPTARRARILLVEDETALRRLLVQVLERQGFTVQPAADGAEALHLWKARPEPFDLVVSDMIMPGGLSGAELLALIGRDDPTMRMLLISGYGASVEGTGPMLLQKPFTVEAFTDAVDQVLRQR